MRFADLDCVTVDAYGTLLALEDPVPALEAELAGRGAARPGAEIAAAFGVEMEYYREHSLEGRDAESLEQLRRDCLGVFLAALHVELDPAELFEAFIAALRFRLERGALDALRLLRGRELALAVVSNWDCSLEQRLGEVGLLGFFDCVVGSALVGAAKPDPRLFHYALEQLEVSPARSLHIGDSDDDRLGAASAGMSFAPAPLELAVRGLSG